MTKSLYLTYEDKEFKKLLAEKEAQEKKLKEPISWKRFIYLKVLSE